MQSKAIAYAASAFLDPVQILGLIPRQHVHTGVARGKRFNLEQFSDFILSQGRLPPDQLAEDVDEQFIPARKER